MLAVSRCAACGEAAFPPRDQCAACGADTSGTALVGGSGRVVASTWVPTPFGMAGFGEGGFGVAWVDLDDGPRVQVLVADEAPDPGSTGTVELSVLDGVDLPLFTQGAA